MVPIHFDTILILFLFYYLQTQSKTPAATAEPITPATFGPIACINKKLAGLYSKPTLFDTRAAIGTAETPAEPINGLTLLSLLENKFIILAIITPAAVANENAKMPRIKMRQHMMIAVLSFPKGELLYIDIFNLL
jgi:hypothetical protein